MQPSADTNIRSNDENLLVAISRQLATTIEKVRLYEETCRAYEDLRKTQEQLLQSEKMSAVGQLIAGVAHELNNPLTAILGYAQLLETEGLNPRAQDFVSKLFKQAQRTHRVVQNLLSFARQRKPQRDEVDIRKVLDETLALRDYDLKINNIKVERDVPSEPAMVDRRPASDRAGLPEHHQQCRRRHSRNRTQRQTEDPYQRMGGHVCTQFTDDGAGIKDPKRIFDPFYTTKSVGKGTGLGLSICYGIVKEHGGDITANNAPEGGATIEVRLPAAVSTAQPKPKPPKPALAPARRRIHGRVLSSRRRRSSARIRARRADWGRRYGVTAKTSQDVKTRLLSEAVRRHHHERQDARQWTAKESYPWLKENCSGMEAPHSLHVLEQRGARRRTRLPAGKQRSLPGEALRSR